MNKKLQNTIKANGLEITSYNNIDLDFGLSFNNLTYTLAYENSKNYLNSNSLLFNIEDTNTIYNVFKHNDVQFSYQLNNILFVDNNKNMHILSYNLRTRKTFSYDNNSITFNILGDSINSLKEFNQQTIFSYNSNQISYIYSNEDKLKYMTLNKPGLYHIDNDDIILNSNQLSINVNKFNYNFLHINNLVDKINNMIHDYSYNISMFGQTKKYKDSTHTTNLTFIENYEGKEINIIISNQNYKLNYKEKITENNGKQIIEPDIDIFIKDTNHLIIDLPIEYNYETIIYNDFKFNKHICPIKIDDIKILTNTNIQSKFQLNKSKSFIHNHKPISIIPNYKNSFYPSILNESCNVSLYFDIDMNIYDEVYKLSKNASKNYSIKLEIKYQYKDQNITYRFNCYIDVMNKQFQKLYHNYNYGFNYDNHGDAIGIMMLPKCESNESLHFNNININGAPKPISTILTHKPSKKDIFVNYDSNNINNIFIPISNINYDIFNQKNSFINFNKMHYYYISTESENPVKIAQDDAYLVIRDLIYPERLKYKNLNLLYKNQKYQNYTIYEYPENNGKMLFNPNILQDVGTICQFEVNDEITLNNPYIMDKEKHKELFDKIYNYRKSGLLCGDYYTPCISDYMLMYLFGIENYFDQYVYKRYNDIFCNENENNQYRLLSNQFGRVRYINDVCQYSVNLTKNPYDNSNIDSNTDNDVLDFNKYYIELYQSRNIQETDKNYIWPLFRIPDYSIINSNNYIIMYSNKENCEYVDYYINPSTDGKYFYINFRSYNQDNDFKFNILNEKMKFINNIQISSINLIDKENNIYQLQIYVQNILKVNIVYIIFKDSEPYMNDIIIGNKNEEDNKYRILCKVYLKNKDI